MCCADGGDLGSDAWHSGRGDVAAFPFPDLVDSDAAHRERPAGVANGQVDLGRAQVADARGHERRHPVQGGDLRAGLDHRPPPPSQRGQLTGVEAYRLPPQDAPAASRHHVADREPIQTERSELAPADDAVPLRGGLLGARQQSSGASSRTHPRTMDPPMAPKPGGGAAVDNGWRVLRALGRSDIPPTGERRGTYGLRARRSMLESCPVRTVIGRVSRTCLPIRPSSGSSIGYDPVKHAVHKSVAGWLVARTMPSSEM